jgi:hypothetical protein
VDVHPFPARIAKHHNFSLSEGQAVETSPLGRGVVADRDHGQTLGLSKLKAEHKIVKRYTRL